MTTRPKPPALDPETVAPIKGTGYPPPFDEGVSERAKRRLGDALGLTNFGVNLTTLAPGVMSAQRHWHSKQDEFVMIVSGELTLVTDAGEQVLTAGMVAGFPAGVADGHHLINKSDADATYLEVGDRTPLDDVDYPDIDLLVRHVDGKEAYVRKDGTPIKATTR